MTKIREVSKMLITYSKIMLVINSCETFNQTIMVSKMIRSFENHFPKVVEGEAWDLRWKLTEVKENLRGAEEEAEQTV